ncbi:Uncharacterized protein TCM_010686 [Theobroma cacao]|uniref:DUF4218 domain-containing protein n=1 Tax=Theobroma cacao TaxID=3641 RepID=A0A061E737_THECC|nr:Uncharacterized protein TCM_010686 [Theobroma cacao]
MPTKYQWSCIPSIIDGTLMKNTNRIESVTNGMYRPKLAIKHPVGKDIKISTKLPIVFSSVNNLKLLEALVTNLPMKISLNLMWNVGLLFLHHLNKNVKNGASVEESICEAYIINEISLFCSIYCEPTIPTRMNKVPQNDDNGEVDATEVNTFVDVEHNEEDDEAEGEYNEIEEELDIEDENNIDDDKFVYFSFYWINMVKLKTKASPQGQASGAGLLAAQPPMLYPPPIPQTPTLVASTQVQPKVLMLSSTTPVKTPTLDAVIASNNATKVWSIYAKICKDHLKDLLADEREKVKKEVDDLDKKQWQVTFSKLFERTHKQQKGIGEFVDNRNHALQLYRKNIVISHRPNQSLILRHGPRPLNGPTVLESISMDLAPESLLLDF